MISKNGQLLPVSLRRCSSRVDLLVLNRGDEFGEVGLGLVGILGGKLSNGLRDL
jgi:hypothetical protein